MKISVIIPAFNAGKSIKECIQSLLSQSLKPFEIIVVDDGSKDNTLQVLKSFGKKIRVLSQENSGPAAARNNGAKKANGELLVFTDSDCVASRDFLKELSKPFKSKEIIGAQGAYKTRQTSLMALFDQADIETRYEKMKKQKFIDFIGSYAAAYRRKEFLQAKGFDEKYKMASGEDPDLSFKLSGQGKKLVFCPNATVYHSHPESIWKYLRTKFYRGYWRVLLYSKFPGKKAGKDSYTSKGVIAGTLLAGIASAGFAAALILEIEGIQGFFTAFFAWVLALSLIAMLFSETILIKKCFSRKTTLGFFAIPIIIFRNFAQAKGIAAAMIRWKW